MILVGNIQGGNFLLVINPPDFVSEYIFACKIRKFFQYLLLLPGFYQLHVLKNYSVGSCIVLKGKFFENYCGDYYDDIENNDAQHRKTDKLKGVDQGYANGGKDVRHVLETEFSGSDPKYGKDGKQSNRHSKLDENRFKH